MANIRAETLEHLGIDADDLDATGTTNLDLLINRSWWDILDRFDFKEKEKTITFQTVAGTRNYSLQTIIGSQIFEAIQNISILSPADSQHIPLNFISQQWYEQIYNEQTSLQAMPTDYFHDNGYIYLNATPDGIYTITMWYLYILNDLTAGNPAIPQQWDELIMLGAVARGFDRARDYSSASAIRQTLEIGFARRKSTDAKEDAQQKMVGVQVYRNPYSVRH